MGNIQFPFSGLLIVIGQLDFVIGLIVNAGRIIKGFTGFRINQKVQFHGIDILQGQRPGFIVQAVQLAGIQKGFIKGILDHVKQGAIFFHNGFNGVPGIFHASKVQAEIRCNPL